VAQVRDSATGGLAGGAGTLLECANWCALPVASGGLGLGPHALVDMAFHAPLALLGLDPHAVEDRWAADRRRRAAHPAPSPAPSATGSGTGSGSDLGVVTGASALVHALPPAPAGYPTMAVAWNAARGAFEVVA
jgi:hypothetical protein